jgi:cobalt-zinc-cadmium efflux system outer membrane protein
MNKLMIALLIISVSSVAIKNSYAQVEAVQVQEITLEDAIRHAMDVSPAQKIAGSLEGIAQGERQQAGLLLNPEISAEAENFGGQESYKDTDSLETTIGLSQTIEIGGKRSARIKVADEGINLAGYDAQSERLGLIYDVTVAYIEAVAAEEQVSIAKEQRKLAQGTLDTVAKRVEAAADPIFQKSKADVALSAAKIAVKKAEQEAKIAKQKLVRYWDGSASKVQLDSRFFRHLEQPQAYNDIVSNLKNSPDYQRWNALHAQSKAAIDLEKSNAIPDPTFNVGVRDFRESGDQAFVVGVSIPFAVFNRNQGNVYKAGHASAKIDAERQRAWIDLETNLATLTEELESSFSAAQMISENTLPAAQKAFSEARKGHSAGKFAYLEVLDAQRTLSEVREEYNDTLKKYHLARAEINRLTASTSTSISSAEGTKNEK